MTNTKSKLVTKILGIKLKKAREQLGLTQEQVAKLAGIKGKGNYYAKIERGEINLTINKLSKLIKVLKIDASEIFPS
ncbi:helix-turn-helix domain-containing protein [Patescibacteria group bacterium]|nr:helix-turn-helix domain-containing protein [Patescibacteria group bacterium]